MRKKSALVVAFALTTVLLSIVVESVGAGGSARADDAGQTSVSSGTSVTESVPRARAIGPSARQSPSPAPLGRRAALQSRGFDCPAPPQGVVTGAPGIWSELGVGGTTTTDLQLFAETVNAIRSENCLEPLPLANFTYDACMEQRLIWMAEDPSQDPSSAWGHIGTTRSDGVPSVGCDGNLTGGTDNTAATAAQRYWDDPDQRAMVYHPGESTENVCIAFAMSHGGVPNEPYPFTRAAARWYEC